MTNIEKLKEIEAAATKGPWSLVDDGRFLTGPDGYLVADCDYFYRPGTEANTALIVAMRNALPALLASLASKDAEIERQALALREMTFSRDTWRKVAEGRGSDIERETKIARAAESRLTTALAALGEAKSGLVEIEAITPHKATRLCARAALAKLNEIERNADG